MKIEEIYLTSGDADKLADLLEQYNKGKDYKDQLSFQEMAEKILQDAIYRRWHELQGK